MMHIIFLFRKIKMVERAKAFLMVIHNKESKFYNMSNIINTKKTGELQRKEVLFPTTDSLIYNLKNLLLKQVMVMHSQIFSFIN